MPYGQYFNNDDNNNFQDLHAIYIQEQHIKSQQDLLRVPVLPHYSSPSAAVPLGYSHAAAVKEIQTNANRKQ